MESRPALALTLVSFAVAGTVLAAECPGEARPREGPATVYGPRSGGYCDGQVGLVHGGGLRILSVRTAGASVAASPPFELEVITDPSLSIDSIRLEGVPLDAALNYRLDARLDSRERPLVIREDAALWSLELAPADIGWAAWTEKPGEERIYLPVPLGPGETGRVEVVARSALQVATLLTVVHEHDGRVRSQTLARSVDPGQPIRVLLPSGSAGLVTVDLVVESAGGWEAETASLRLWRPGT